MLESSRRLLLDRLTDEDVVLDIGGWADPFNRADWVMDLMPYESRGLYRRRGWIAAGDAEPERFRPETWIQRDICDREPYPFTDGEIDFVICAQTLEDVRDPVWVCSEMMRVGKAGYIEAPSMLDELSYGFRGPMVGWEHHRWLINAEQERGRIEFILKDHTLHWHPDAHFPTGFRDRLSTEERVTTLWWEGSFDYGERIFIESSIDRHLSDFVGNELAARRLPGRVPETPGGPGARLRRILGRRALP